MALVAVAGGLLFWFHREHSAPKKTDCEIVAEMLSYGKARGDEISAFIAKPDEDDNQSVLLGMYKTLIDGTQKYVDQIVDPKLKSEAQAVVDSEKALVEYQRSVNASPPPQPIGGSSPEAENVQKRFRALFLQQEKAIKSLEQACPATGGPPSPL